MAAQFKNISSRIVCVIPTLNAVAALARTLEPLKDLTLVVADGGSTDGTQALAKKYGARIVISAKGRGQQLMVGGDAAVVGGARWLLFLHADTRLDAAGLAEATAFARAADNLFRAATFSFALDDNGPAAHRLQRLVDWRCRVMGLPYGDQGLLISADFYNKLGGFQALELMEDVDMVRRIGRKRLHLMQAHAMTSAERYKKSGYLLRSLRNLSCLGLYFLGVPVRHIARLYR